MNPEAGTRYWCVRMNGGRYLNDVKRYEFIAIGWPELPDLSWLTKLPKRDARNKLMKLYKQNYPEASRVAVGVNCTQILNFVVDIKQGHVVLTPGRDTVLISKVVSNYYYEENPAGTCPYKHRRRVKVIKEVKREDLPERLKSAFYAWQTVFNLDAYGTYIQELITGKPSPEEFVTGPHVSEILMHRLLDLSPRFFQEKLIPSLLRAMGFEAEAAPTYQGDRGVDVSGYYKMGFFEGDVRIQVKRVRQPIPPAWIRELRGSLRAGQKGIFITTSNFTEEARREAEDISKPGGRIILIDGKVLSGLILEFYDKLDKDVKDELEKRLGLRKDFIIVKR